jgi:glucose-1-phosphate adenylyltransferase
MDYGAMLAAHVENSADITIGCIEVPVEEASGFGVMGVDDNWRVQSFTEKPANPASVPGDPSMALCSMGIYIFNKDFLIEQLIRDADSRNSSHDFGKDVIPNLINKYHAYAYSFQDPVTHKKGYWRDVGTVDSYWQANMELIEITPELNLYDQDWPIWTYQEQLPPAKFVFDDEIRRGQAINSMVSGGCIISGARVRNSVLFSNVEVQSFADIDGVLALPEVRIGEHCVIKRAVIDKGCDIPDGMKIGVNLEEDKKRFYVSPKGIVLVIPEMLGQEIHHVR